MSEIIVIGMMDNTVDHTFKSANMVYGVNGIAPTVNTCGGGGLQAKVMEVSALRMVRTDEGKKLRKAYEAHEINHGFNEHRKAEPRTDGVCNTLTTVQKDNYMVETQSVAMRGRYSEDGSTSQHLEVRADGVCNALTTVQKDSLVMETATGLREVPKEFERFVYEIDGKLYLIRIRKLTPRECWRLMGFTDDDYDKAAKVNSHTQLYKQAGNSIVKNVLMSVFKQMLPPMNRMEYLRRKALAALNM